MNYFFIILVVLLGVCAFFFYRLFRLEKRLKTILGVEVPEHFQAEILRRITRLEMWREEITPKINILEKIAGVAVQKVGFLRFNPFEDTGGDNSFVMVLLDHKNDGIVISSLYARGGVRMFGKQIITGKPKQLLSHEEKRVLEETIAKS